MIKRNRATQTEHDAAVSAAATIYREHGKYAWSNPDSEENKPWMDRYIDVIAADSTAATKAWVIEIETEDSVSASEATTQWADYDNVYTCWHLAVPRSLSEKARALCRAYGITHCSIATWEREPDGCHAFWGLPGLD